mmetsp:Transcript_6210/g.9671  ORF Transcript_6210/g.9671 Transcript_6210/m.9671 type:complete len:1005 (+) Transcript_6210:223-3237(+)
MFFKFSGKLFVVMWFFETLSAVSETLSLSDPTRPSPVPRASPGAFPTRMNGVAKQQTVKPYISESDLDSEERGDKIHPNTSSEGFSSPPKPPTPQQRFAQYFSPAHTSHRATSPFSSSSSPSQHSAPSFVRARSVPSSRFRVQSSTLKTLGRNAGSSQRGFQTQIELTQFRKSFPDLKEEFGRSRGVETGQQPTIRQLQSKRNSPPEMAARRLKSNTFGSTRRMRSYSAFRLANSNFTSTPVPPFGSKDGAYVERKQAMEAVDVGARNRQFSTLNRKLTGLARFLELMDLRPSLTASSHSFVYNNNGLRTSDLRSGSIRTTGAAIFPTAPVTTAAAAGAASTRRRKGGSKWRFVMSNVKLQNRSPLRHMVHEIWGHWSEPPLTTARMAARATSSSEQSSSSSGFTSTSSQSSSALIPSFSLTELERVVLTTYRSLERSKSTDGVESRPSSPSLASLVSKADGKKGSQLSMESDRSNNHVDTSVNDAEGTTRKRKVKIKNNRVGITSDDDCNRASNLTSKFPDPSCPEEWVSQNRHRLQKGQLCLAFSLALRADDSVRNGCGRMAAEGGGRMGRGGGTNAPAASSPVGKTKNFNSYTSARKDAASSERTQKFIAKLTSYHVLSSAREIKEKCSAVFEPAKDSTSQLASSVAEKEDRKPEGEAGSGGVIKKLTQMTTKIDDDANMEIVDITSGNSSGGGGGRHDTKTHGSDVTVVNRNVPNRGLQKLHIEGAAECSSDQKQHKQPGHRKEDTSSTNLRRVFKFANGQISDTLSQSSSSSLLASPSIVMAASSAACYAAEAIHKWAAVTRKRDLEAKAKQESAVRNTAQKFRVDKEKKSKRGSAASSSSMLETETTFDSSTNENGKGSKFFETSRQSISKRAYEELEQMKNKLRLRLVVGVGDDVTFLDLEQPISAFEKSGQVSVSKRHGDSFLELEASLAPLPSRMLVEWLKTSNESLMDLHWSFDVSSSKSSSTSSMSTAALPGRDVMVPIGRSRVRNLRIPNDT